MRAQILEQPLVLRSLLARRDEVAKTIERMANGVRHVWALGHGDSYFAPLAASTAFQAFCSLPYTPVLAQEMAAYPPAEVSNGLVIAVSMSGAVGKTIMAASAAKALGARILAITNVTTSPLTEVASATIYLGIREPMPFLAGTATYTATLVTLLVIALVMGGAESGFANLDDAVTAVESALESEAKVREWTLSYRAARTWYFLGMGCHVATAHYGAAKLAEVADAIGIAYETEEFFHEHHWVVREDQPIIVLIHDAASRERGRMAAEYLRELGTPIGLVGPGADGSAGIFHLSIPEVAPWCASIPGAVPLQWLAYWLSRARGLDPDRRSHLLNSPRYEISRRNR